MCTWFWLCQIRFAILVFFLGVNTSDVVVYRDALVFKHLFFMENKNMKSSALIALIAALALAAGLDLGREFFFILPGISVVRPLPPMAEGSGAVLASSQEVAIGKLFGEPTAAPVLASVLPRSESISTVSTPKFTVAGVMAGTNGLAILIDESGNDGIYRSGDVLPGGYRLVAITAEAVQLSMDGGQHLLQIDWSDVKNTGNPVSMPAAAGAVASEITPETR